MPPSRALLRRAAGRAARHFGALAVLACALGPARAGVQAQPADTGNGYSIDRSALQAPSPSPLPAAASPATEALVHQLRATALSSPARTSARPAARRRAGEPAEPTADLPPRDAAWLLGLLALHGLAMPADMAQARQWFERAQMLGHPLAPAGLAWCRIDGCTEPANPALARPWITQLRRADPPRAMYLEWLVATRLAPLAPPAPAPPLEQPRLPPPMRGAPERHLLVAAAQAGNPQALNELGLESMAAGQNERALAQFQAAAVRSEAAGANARLLASRIAAPLGTAGTGARSASDWFEQARRYHQGDGVPANYAEAIRLYQIAAGAGDAAARRMLELIFSRPAPTGVVDVEWMRQLAALDVRRSTTPQIAGGAPAPAAWQRDPTPLYDLVPPEWRALATTRRP